MGFLRESDPLSWEESLDSLRFIRNHGIEQFLAVFRRCRHIHGDPFKWGDEIEHGIFRLVGSAGDDDRSVKVVFRSPDVLAQLRALEAQLEGQAVSGSIADGNHEPCNWMPEFGRWMIESTPGRPFQGLADLAKLEAQMNVRRSRLAATLREDEVAPTVTSMPLFGTPDFCEPFFAPDGYAAASLFVPDEAIFPHPRFPTLTRNIRMRRGGRVEIRRPRLGGPPVAQGAVVPTTPEQADALDHVYADAMAFGMGCCCLQVTMQASDLSESRHLYDQLAPLTPILLALTAATPFLRGWICDDDTRWGQVSQSVDDRTPAERGLDPRGATGDERMAGAGLRVVTKSRYSSIDCYMGEDPKVSEYNDIPVVVDDEFVLRLVEHGLDTALARHVAHLFARDPLVLFGDRIDLDDEHDVDHWENLQSTNWQTLRWKPPPPEKGALASSAEDHIGWRVEFRSMEVQVTDFENAAFTSFVILLSRTILDLNLTLYVPMSKLEANMAAAQRGSACTAERFWFRTSVLPEEQDDANQPYALMTIHEILMGFETFPGLIPLCRQYLDATGCDVETKAVLDRYLLLIERRAAGSLMTTAAWMRRFVLQHESYKQDGRVPKAAAHDLMVAATEIGDGKRHCPELHKDIFPPVAAEPVAVPSLSSVRPLAKESGECSPESLVQSVYVAGL
mmetsp:Transcript_101710/g.286773  ORF Transcript_101710/g.286773 Transcript_101710/m.286773 type:complete len:677 (+) Transcript_101710:65-2095(+)